MLFLNEFLVLGIILGFTAGISPGPLMAMTISETLQHGSRAGVKVAISPLITDSLIVSCILFFLLSSENHGPVLAWISFAGAFYLIYLGVSSLKTSVIDIVITKERDNSFKRGILANFLSPHPYLFWITIGGPILFQALDVDIWATVFFVAGFYSLLVGSKIMIAMVVGRSRYFLKSNYYLYIIRSLGLVYFIFALFFIEQGTNLLGLKM
jgi:threonine/homoserine/homoserine lactone efflux protein